MVTNKVHKLGIMTLAGKESCQQHGYITLRKQALETDKPLVHVFAQGGCVNIAMLCSNMNLVLPILHICKVSFL